MSDKIQDLIKIYFPMSPMVDSGKVAILLPRNSKVGQQAKAKLARGEIVLLKPKELRGAK